MHPRRPNIAPKFYIVPGIQNGGRSEISSNRVAVNRREVEKMDTKLWVDVSIRQVLIQHGANRGGQIIFYDRFHHKFLNAHCQSLFFGNDLVKTGA